ncbi:hemolysin family protein [Tolumonas osonensis]|uniref:Polyamine export protein n=1 Tax=Tolumonas osonensis TaxID=675874 RepID=A0A841GMS6_9GAMM|nr:hemolysin family protein [Tolumonas osonensis]MBB6055772.1 CBS domain containing-hemolysin-like protein [Tolumonas osonensis]
MTNSIFSIAVLIIASAFFSVSEIALAASRRLKLQQLAESGSEQANKVIALQEQPGHYFTVVQIGLNAVAILGGIIGESALTPYVSDVLQYWIASPLLDTISFAISFMLVTSLFILFADLIPKRLAMMAPEQIAIHIVNPMLFCVAVFKPLVFIFNGLANLLFRLFKLPTTHKEVITPDDIYAMMSAGAQAGVLREQEHHLIENVFELDSKTVPSTMTSRDGIIYFDRRETEEEIRQKIAEHPHSKFLVCDNNIDTVLGYVDSKDILLRVLNKQPISLTDEKLIHTPLIIPDTLTLTEALEGFKGSREDFAVILNEYALVVGIITLNDIMNTLMGDLVNQHQEEQIIQRDDHSWLIDGIAPIDDVMRVLDIETFPEYENYETIAGFMMFMLRKIPKRTDSVTYAGYKFEVVDIDSYKIDQLLVTRIANTESENLSLPGK